MRRAILSLMLTAAVCGCSQNSETGSGNESQTASASAEAASFNVDKVGLPGEGRGDYIFADPDTRRLYVTHTGAVHVLDLDTLKPLAKIGGMQKAHGVAVVHAAGKGFISDEAGKILVFDLDTNKLIKTIKGGENPDSIVFDPFSKKVFVFNGTSKDVSVIDPDTAEIVKSIPVGDKPEFSRADGKGKIFVNLEDGAAIAVIDTAKQEVATQYKLADCEGPAGLGFDEANRRLFSSCGNKQLKVVDADSGKVLQSLPVGEDPDGIVYDPNNKLIYVANRDGAWTILKQVDADHYNVAQTLKIDEYAKTLGFDAKTGRVFSSSADLIWPKEVPGKKHLPDAKPGSFRLLVVSKA